MTRDNKDRGAIWSGMIYILEWSDKMEVTEHGSYTWPVIVYYFPLN